MDVAELLPILMDDFGTEEEEFPPRLNSLGGFNSKSRRRRCCLKVSTLSTVISSWMNHKHYCSIFRDDGYSKSSFSV